MLDSVRNVKTSHLRLNQQLGRSEQAWLLQHLRSKRGVRDATYFDDEQKLVVSYDADYLNSYDLMVIIQACGIQARPPRLALGEEATR